MCSKYLENSAETSFVANVVTEGMLVENEVGAAFVDGVVG
jgi:hypothetical protein